MKNLIYVFVVLSSLNAIAAEKYTEVVKLDPVLYNDAQVLAVTADEQKKNFQRSGMNCISYNDKTHSIAAARADLFCKIYLNNEKAVVISALYGLPTKGNKAFDSKDKQIKTIRQNNGNFYCIYFVDATFQNLTCGVPVE